VPPVKKTVRKKTTAKKTPAKKTPAKKTPAKKTPAKKTPAKKQKAARSSPSSSVPADIAAYHRAQTASDQALCALLSREIAAAMPDAEAKVWHRHPVWFLEGNPVVGYSRLKESMRIFFWSGQSFDEPRLTPGGFKAAEHRLGGVDAVDLVDLRRWLQKARDIQWDYKNIVKRKGRLERLR
jgi:hypothetical protein